MQILIVNDSSAEPLANIATEALEAGHEVRFLCLQNDESPFSGFYNFFLDNSKEAWSKAIDDLANVHNFAERHRDRYQEERFDTPLNMVQRIADFGGEWTIIRSSEDYRLKAA